MLLASIRLRPAFLTDNKEAWLATKYAKTTINFSRGFSINAETQRKIHGRYPCRRQKVYALRGESSSGKRTLMDLPSKYRVSYRHLRAQVQMVQRKMCLNQN